jgi:hypothetical protein
VNACRMGSNNCEVLRMRACGVSSRDHHLIGGQYLYVVFRPSLVAVLSVINSAKFVILAMVIYNRCAVFLSKEGAWQRYLQMFMLCYVMLCYRFHGSFCYIVMQ